ncbi:MAG: hypothetical protein ABI553_06530 [Chloroflexota bacterium]
MTTVRPALDAALRRTIALRTEALLRAAGAVHDGDGRLEPDRMLEDPAATSDLCAFVAEHGRGLDLEPLVDYVAATSAGGRILAFETARQLGVRCLLGDAAPDGVAAPARPFSHAIERGARILLVDASVSADETLAAAIEAIESVGGEIVECVVLVDASGAGRATITSPASDRVYPLRSLWQHDFELDVSAG